MILALSIMMCVAVTINAFAAEDETPDIEVNGKVIGMTAKVRGGELLLPLRAVSEELGSDVKWLEEKYELVNGKKAGYTNGEK